MILFLRTTRDSIYICFSDCSFSNFTSLTTKCIQVLYLVVLVENRERPLVLGLGSELEVLNVLRDNLSVCD